MRKTSGESSLHACSAENEATEEACPLLKRTTGRRNCDLDEGKKKKRHEENSRPTVEGPSLKPPIGGTTDVSWLLGKEVWSLAVVPSKKNPA